MLPKQQNLQNTMLDADQLASLQHTIGSYSPLQLAWASGYLAAKSEGASISVSPTAAAIPAATLTILFGSQTGNAKGVAKALAAQAQAQGLTVDLKSMSDFKP